MEFVSENNAAAIRDFTFDEFLAPWNLSERDWLIKHQKEKEWDGLPEIQARGNPPFPLHFSSDELDTINKDAAGAIRGMEQMKDLKAELGDLWPEKGLVRHDQYKDVKIALASAKDCLLTHGLIQMRTERYGNRPGRLTVWIPLTRSSREVIQA